MSRLWRRPAVLIAITAVLMLAAGVAVGWAASTAAPGNDSVEAGFARDMQTHHQQAVEMAMYEWQNGSDAAMTAIAYDIATSQSAEIGMYRSWLRDWDVRLSSGDPMAWAGEEHAHDSESSGGLMPGMATDEQMAEFKTLTGSDADIMFAELMIAHHIGGIDMAKIALERSDNDLVVDAAQRTVAVQQSDITNLQGHLDNILSAVEE
ncbi:DUF305 domain-containing protein [Glycomyces harbinensis]|uniref:Uncharacterized conserved protein, DUF305 family n=1 Tax=Glycomyces harbinensis TaxID=58114 RepID=A0A1G6TV47_9ACTN|nr:DUF305 domain-containing protein [Glycomyces harbinensis]SDD33042.1 Uncharacterized conserved protein, DUF305 family [Glycomyces harbinensis]